MSAARYFYKAYSPKMLNQIYKEKIQYRASAGMDNITPKVFVTNRWDGDNSRLFSTPFPYQVFSFLFVPI